MPPASLALLAPLLALPLGGSAAPPAPAPAAPRPNVLVVLLDDVGTDMVGAYGVPGAPCTPFLDALAAAGARFERCYVDPVCSPSRAALLTGRHGLRTGVGTAVLAGSPERHAGLELAELTLPEHLRAHGYATVGVGKWHLSGLGHTETHPNQQGFDRFAGHLGGVLERGYSDWDRTEDGVTRPTTTYATTRNVVDALRAVGQLPEPWLCYVSFNAAHAPYHAPPPGACGACAGGPGCGCPVPPSAPPEARYRAMVESLDAHVRALFEALQHASAGNLVTFVLGDNGTPRKLGAPCPRPGKGLVYEGGIRVPLIVHGPGVVPGVRPDLVSGTDLFATVAELVDAPIPPQAEDSLSFAPVLRGAPGPRRAAYAEFFSPNGLPFAPEEHRRAVVDQRWKLIRRTGAPGLPAEELFDLASDPCETTDLLLAPLSPEARAAYLRLEDELERLGG